MRIMHDCTVWHGGFEEMEELSTLQTTGPSESPASGKNRIGPGIRQGV